MTSTPTRSALLIVFTFGPPPKFGIASDPEKIMMPRYLTAVNDLFV
jgi:hypothetical protein